MRLSKAQVDTILGVCRDVAGEGVRVSVYGSRLDDSRRGGDVDVLLEPSLPLGLMERARIKLRLEERLQLPVDLVVHNPDRKESAFVAMIRPLARRMEPNP